MPMTTVQLILESDMPPELDASIRQLLVTCFSKDAGFFSGSRAWHGSAPEFSAVIVDEGRLIAHLGVVQRRITVGGAAADVAGVQNVAVLPERRGRGLSRTMLAPAMDEALRRGLDYGLLFCEPKTVPIYARCGWSTLPDQSVVRVDSDGLEKPLLPGNLSMWRPLAKPVFPPGAVHLGGNDW
ncbi:MAG: GNAT family N-acetyltransferase [Thermoguttaceae bacterium]